MVKEKSRIRILGDPVLKTKVTEVEITDDLRELSACMLGMMFKYDGVGLAASQIGINKRVIVINTPPDYLEKNLATSPGEGLLLPQMPITLINPEIVGTSTEKSTGVEGCLSVPEVYAPVERYAEIELKAQLLSGEKIQISCGGFLARILQHEIDHLNGILFVDRLSRQDHKKIEKQLKQLKKHHF